MLNIAFGQSKYFVDNLRENAKRGLRQKIRSTERYISETMLEKQIRGFLQKVSLSSQDTQKVLAAVDDDEKQAQEEQKQRLPQIIPDPA